MGSAPTGARTWAAGQEPVAATPTSVSPWPGWPV